MTVSSQPPYRAHRRVHAAFVEATAAMLAPETVAAIWRKVEEAEASAQACARLSIIHVWQHTCKRNTEEKQAIVEESLAPNASIMAVARKHGIGTGQLYNWRHQFLGRRSGKAACFARVDITEQPPRLAGALVRSSSSSAGLIEIVLVGGPTIRGKRQPISGD